MKIDRVELYHVVRDEKSAADTVLVKLVSGAACGWGEACPGIAPTETSEYNRGVYTVLEQHLAPAIVGATYDTAEALPERLAQFCGNAFAKLALDSAWWQLQAAMTGKSLAELWGANGPAPQPSRTCGVLPTIDDLMAWIEREQHHADLLLLKFRAGWDEQMLRAVRQVYPSAALAIDCDGGCQLSQREMFYRLEDFMLRWIEQPFAADDPVAPAMLQEELRTPLCLHQSVTSVDRLEQLIDLQSCRAVRIDPGLLGGFTPALAASQTAAAASLQQTVGGCAYSHEAAAALATLAQLPGINLPCDLPSADTLQPAEALASSAEMHAAITG